MLRFASAVTSTAARLAKVIITLFLTMLVGAGGNAGNQCAVHVIRGLATKQINGTRRVIGRLVVGELLAGALTASAMCVIAFFRVRGMSFLVSDGVGDNLKSDVTTIDSQHIDAIAIAVSLFIIVLSSTLIGTVLPLGMYVPTMCARELPWQQHSLFISLHFVFLGGREKCTCFWFPSSDESLSEVSRLVLMFAYVFDDAA